MKTRDAEVVQRQRVVVVERDRTLIALQRVGGAARLVQRHAPFIPQLRTVGLRGHRLVVETGGGGTILPQQVHFGHGLRDQAAVLAVLQRELVLLERLRVVALLPEGQAQVEMREGAAGNRRGFRFSGRRLAAALEGQVRLGAA